MTYHDIVLYTIIITAVITGTIDYAEAVEDVTTCSLRKSLDSLMLLTLARAFVGS